MKEKIYQDVVFIETGGAATPIVILLKQKRMVITIEGLNRKVT